VKQLHISNNPKVTAMHHKESAAKLLALNSGI
jgi:hypothetical protein